MEKMFIVIELFKWFFVSVSYVCEEIEKKNVLLGISREIRWIPWWRVPSFAFLSVMHFLLVL